MFGKELFSPLYLQVDTLYFKYARATGGPRLREFEHRIAFHATYFTFIKCAYSESVSFRLQPVQRGSRAARDVGGEPRLRRGAHLQAHDQGPHAGHRPGVARKGDIQSQ